MINETEKTPLSIICAKIFMYIYICRGTIWFVYKACLFKVRLISQLSDCEIKWPSSKHFSLYFVLCEVNLESEKSMLFWRSLKWIFNQLDARWNIFVLRSPGTTYICDPSRRPSPHQRLLKPSCLIQISCEHLDGDLTRSPNQCGCWEIRSINCC